MRRAIVYIDGFNLYYGIRSLRNPTLKWLDVECLAKSFLRPDTHLEQVKYFTTMIKGDIEKVNRQQGGFNINAKRLKTCLLPAEIVTKKSRLTRPKAWQKKLR